MKAFFITLAAVALILIGSMIAASFVGAQDFDETVRDAQAELAKRGYKIDVDGVWGRDTREVVRDFQRDHELPVTGEIDVATAATLFGGEKDLDRKAPPVADDAPYQDRERADRELQQCKPAAIDEISTAYYLKGWAQSNAKANWARKAQAYHGEVYADPDHARVKDDECHKVVVGKLNKWRCNFVAFPCRQSR